MLKKHTLLMPTFTYNNSVATLKEFCAPVLWADGASFSLGAVKQLSPAERVALCNVFGLAALPTAVADQSDRIVNYVTAKRAANASSRAGTQVGGTGASQAGAGPTSAATRAAAASATGAQPPPQAAPAHGEWWLVRAEFSSVQALRVALFRSASNVESWTPAPVGAS